MMELLSCLWGTLLCQMCSLIVKRISMDNYRTVVHGLEGGMCLRVKVERKV